MDDSETPYYSILDKLDKAVERLDFLFKRHMHQLEQLKKEAANPLSHGIVMLRRRRRPVRRDTSTLQTLEETKDEEDDDDDKAEESEYKDTEATEEEPPIIEEMPQIIEQPPITAYLRVAFERVGKVNTTEGHYTARLLIEARWIDPNLHRRYTRPIATDWTNVWNPELYISNLQPGAKVVIRRSMKYESGSNAVVFEKQDILGEFDFEINNKRYPFETQELVVTIRSRYPATRVLLEQDMNVSSDISAALNIPEWKLLNYLVIRQGVLIDPYAVDSGEMAMFSVICTAKHRPMFLLLNAFIAMTGICFMAFLTLCIDQANTNIRILACFFLLLTIITLMRLIHRATPKTATPTLVDAHVLMSIFVVFVVTCWNGILTGIPLGNRLAIDRSFLTVAAGIYVLFIVVVYLMIMTRYLYARIPKSKESELNEEFAPPMGEETIINPEPTWEDSDL